MDTYANRQPSADGVAGPSRGINSLPPAPFAIARSFARRSLLVEADSPARTVYLVRAGQVRVFLLREDGQETTTAWLGPGQIVGIAPLLGRHTHHAFVEALTDVEAWAIPA